ncbi:MAG: hypothetical protein WBA13_06520 [Microcoleaceae cyanobacterium]
MGIALIFYFVAAITAFCVWFKLLIEDTTTAINDYRSWLILIIASLIWPLTTPIALIELLLQADIDDPHQPPLTSFQSRLNLKASTNSLPLGYILKQAGLITEYQVVKALEAQQTSQRHRRIGEIIVYYGWLQPETIDFFAEDLPQVSRLPQQPIGQYLKQAKLLDDEQIEDILTTQQQTQLMFGEVAVKKGWIKPETITLILRYIGRHPKTYSHL